MLYLTYSLNFLLMMALPVLLGICLTRRFRLGWGLWAIGAATFVLSQVVHIPLNLGLTALFTNGLLPPPPDSWKPFFNPIVLGLTAGLCEETARYLVYRFWIRGASTWREGVLFGAGHGGIEAIIFGGVAAWTTIQLFAFRDVDLTTLSLTPEQMTLAQQQVEAFWSAPWYATLLGAVERVFALSFHMAMAVVVLQAIKRRNLLWLGLAVAAHTLLNAVTLYAIPLVGPYWTEVIVGGFSLVSLALLFALRPAQDEAVSVPVTMLPSTSTAPARLSPREASEQLANSRFSE
jgi:uncharacterized membrane protein YhfC